MVLRIYLIMILTMLVVMAVGTIFESEQKRRSGCGKKRYIKFINSAVKILDFIGSSIIALFGLYNVFTLIYAIVGKHWYFMGIPILFLLFTLFYFISEHFEILDFLTEGLALIFLFLWMVYMAFFVMLAIGRPINGEEVTNKSDLVENIDILEFKQVPYTTIEGRRYYIKSAPDSAYYYEVRTANGGTTTKVIDGSKNYVEKFESDEYIDNPHIEVYRNYTISHYISWYGNEVTEEKSSSYSYYIYMPKNSMFYEE